MQLWTFYVNYQGMGTEQPAPKKDVTAHADVCVSVSAVAYFQRAGDAGDLPVRHRRNGACICLLRRRAGVSSPERAAGTAAAGISISMAEDWTRELML